MAIQNLGEKKNSLYNKSYRPLDGLYGPWSRWEELYASIYGCSIEDVLKEDIDDLQEILKQGVTVAIIENGAVVEYWKPEENGGFVVKSPDVEVSDSDIADAVSDYFAENPPTGVSDDKIADAVKDYLDAHPSTLTEDDVNDIVDGKLFKTEGEKTSSIYVPREEITDNGIIRARFNGRYWGNWNAFATEYKEYKGITLYDDTKEILNIIPSSLGLTPIIDGVEYWKPKQSSDGLGGFVPKQSDTQFGYFVDDLDSDPYDDEYVDGAVRFSDFVERERVIAESLNDLNDRIKDTDVSELSKRIEDVAEVSASSIISLDTRIDKLEETLVNSVDKDGAGLLLYQAA